MTKEDILLKHCDGEELGRHPSDSTYCEIGGAIDGKTEHVLAAMEEYAEQFNQEKLIYWQDRYKDAVRELHEVNAETEDNAILFALFLSGGPPELRTSIKERYNEFLDGISYT